VDEMDLCLEGLDKWQDSVVRCYDNWLKKMKAWRLEEVSLPEHIQKWEEKGWKVNEKAFKFHVDENLSYKK
jgi:hypothetical protein